MAPGPAICPAASASYGQVTPVPIQCVPKTPGLGVAPDIVTAAAPEFLSKCSVADGVKAMPLKLCPVNVSGPAVNLVFCAASAISPYLSQRIIAKLRPGSGSHIGVPPRFGILSGREYAQRRARRAARQ